MNWIWGLLSTGLGLGLIWMFWQNRGLQKQLQQVQTEAKQLQTEQAASLQEQMQQTEQLGQQVQELKHALETERTQAKALKQEMELKVQEQEQFTYIASHDLQEPLRKIRNFSEMLRERTQENLDARSLKYMKYITEGAERMQTLLQNLLLYSRAMRKAPQQEVDLDTILKHALDDLELRIQETQAEITATPLPHVHANPTHMQQLFQNLLSNALKFCQERPQIQIEAHPEDDAHWLFSVRDNGIGMDPQDTGRIFEAFQRLHRKNEYPGTGIGLAICQKIIHQHQGKIWVESRPNEGSTFFFTLPVSQEVLSHESK